MFARPSDSTESPFHRFKAVVISRKDMFAIITLAIMAATAALTITSALGTGGNDNLNANSSASDTTGSSAPSAQESEPNTSKAAPVKPGNISATNRSSASAVVNGQPVAVPQNGPYNETVDVPGGTVRISGSSAQSTTGGSATNNTMTNVEVNTNSGT